VKAISPQLRTHLAHPVTTLATCWRVIRTDGASFAFTSFDDDLVVDGVTYSSTAGFTRSAIQSGSQGEVDNLDLLGFFQPDAITERDLKNGLFDYATVYVFAVNWADLTQGICRLRRGWLGETTLSPAGIFHAELRGLTQALVQEFGDQYMPLCRADLGDSKCRMPIKPVDWTATRSVSKGDFVRAHTRGTDALELAIFKAQGNGTTGDTEPVWDTTIGAFIADGSVTWQSAPYWRGIFTVAGEINQHRFIASPLSAPAAPTIASDRASVSFQGTTSSGTSLTVSDGLISHSISASGEAGPLPAANIFFYAMSQYHDWAMTVTQISNTIFFQNNSGEQGYIIKIGDIHSAVVVSDFQTGPFEGGTVEWIDGDNAGRSMEVKSYDAATNTVTLWLGMNFAIRAGDRFFAYPGCDKRRDTCVNVFNNILNFRAEPDMPMFDKILSYPDA
jgi:hypothetical protein